MVVCNRFDVRVTVSGDENPVVAFSIHTDLPAGTKIIYSCYRSYLAFDGYPQAWSCQSERLIVSAEGECGAEIDMMAADAKAYGDFQKRSRIYPSSGISTPVSDTVTLSITVPIRQVVKDFGRDNSNLRGEWVTERGDLKVVQAEREFIIPMNPKFQPAMSSEEDLEDPNQ